MSETLSRARPKPRIDHPEQLDRLVRRIVAKIDPLAIYLFGSRARGDADADSDYDLMVVVPDERMTRDIWDRLWEARRGQGIGAELIPTRPSSFTWRRHEVGTLEHEVQLDGVQLYAARGWSPGPAPAERAMNTTVVAEWLRRVEKDLGVARLCCDAADPVPDQAAYHVQQAAEKLTKGALVAHGKRPRKGHKIEEFAPQLPKSFPLKGRFERLGRFSKFAWAHRYPEEEGQEPIPEPSVGEARAWLDEVAALKADFERWLAGREGEGA